MNFILENYEWDNTWIEKTSINTKKRVLYIGDSISCGTRNQANILSQGEILFDGFGTSKSLDNPYYFPSLSSFMQQMPVRDVIIFNNGLHGWHLSEDEYEKLYDSFLEQLIEQNPKTPILLILTTSTTDAAFPNDRVIKRNEVVRKIADRRGLKVIDLYTVSKNHRDTLSPDGVHYFDQGYSALAAEILKVLEDVL